MKGYFVIGIGALLLGGLLWYFLVSGDDITNYPPKNEVIVAFGDSLVFGQGATEGNDFVSLLGQKLEKFFCLKTWNFEDLFIQQGMIF